MHIVMLSDVETQGGAGIAASRLAEALCRAGHRITRLVGIADGQENVWSTQRLVFSNTSLPYRIVRGLFPSKIQDLWDRQNFHTQLKRIFKDLDADTINIHNLHGASLGGWLPDLMRVCVDHARTVWTLHDMWSFTGRCAYSEDCSKYSLGCDALCPTPTEYPSLAPERIRGAWEKRRDLFQDHPNLVAVTPSKWLAQVAKGALWAKNQVEVISNGLPLRVFHPLDRRLAREALGIHTPGPVLLVAAQNLTERRKGGKLLMEALRRLSHREFTLVTLGAGHLNINAERIHLHPLGFVDHERTRVLAYNAADLFVHPATMDNLPNVVMESIACGTPTVGFSMGGVPDMVRPGQTGWLSSQVSPEGLSSTLERALDDLSHGRDLRSSCRTVAEAEYSDDLQAQRYVTLFRSLDEKDPIEN